MKKILLVGAFILSAVTFSNTHGNHNMGTGNSSGMMGGKAMMQNDECPMMNGKGMMMGGKGMMSNMTPDQRMLMEKDMIAIQEKQLEVRKLMNTAKPDNAKIEKLNSEIMTMRTKHMESMQKMMVTPAKTN